LARSSAAPTDEQPKYPRAILPDAIHWGKYAWDENYRDTARMHNTWPTGSAPCKAACPAHVPVQAYLQKAKEGKYQEAVELIRTMNPFPAVCGRICNKRCEDACTRGTIDQPVSIDAVKKFVADFDLAQEKHAVAQPRGAFGPRPLRPEDRNHRCWSRRSLLRVLPGPSRLLAPCSRSTSSLAA
jgi:hypothetical protein